MVSTGVYGDYTRTDAKDGNRTDNFYLIGGNVSYSLSRKLRTVFDIHYRDKDSTSATESYSEFGALISLVYGYNLPAREVASLFFPDFYGDN